MGIINFEAIYQCSSQMKIGRHPIMRSFAVPFKPESF